MYLFSNMSCHGYLVTKCWFPPVKNAPLCKSCQLIKDKHTLNDILNCPYDRKKMETYLYSRAHDAIFTIQDTFDKIANYLYRNDKDLLEQYIWSNKSFFSKRVYTHNDTQLCHVVGYMLRKKPDVPMPGCCLMCLAHTLRYTDDEYVRSLIFRSVVVRYTEGPNVESMVRKSNSTPLYEFGAALLEKQGHGGVFEEYMKILMKWKPEEADNVDDLLFHPVINTLMLAINIDCDTARSNKRRVYNFFKAKKDVFFEELLAKSMHPSRVFHWCFDIEDVADLTLSPYTFKQGRAEWDIDWV